MQSTSPRFSLDGVDVQKILTGLCVGLAGVAITIFGMLSGISFHVLVNGNDVGPILSMVVSTLISALINLLRKYITDHSTQV